MSFCTRILALLFCLISCDILASEHEWHGRPLGEYISHLTGQGLKVIYSNDLVHDDLVVMVEPESNDSLASLREVLRPHDLIVTTGPGNTWLVIRDPDAESAEPDVDESALQQPLPEIVVSSSVYSVRYQKAGSHVFLDRDFVTGLPDVGEETLRPLDRIPGVANGGVSARSYVRGGAANEQLIIFDGLRLYEPYHLKDFHTVATTIDQSAVEGIDFYTAGYQARYGDRMSGVVDIGMRKAAEEPETELGISFFNTWALSIGRFGDDGRGDWLVSARRSNLDLISRALNSDLGSPQFSDVLMHIGWELSDRSYIAANYLYSFDRIELAQEDGSEEATARYRNRVGWLKMDTEWSSTVSSSTILSVSDIANVRSGQSDLPGVLAGVVDDRRDFRSYTLTQDWDINVSDIWTFRVGFDLKDLDADYQYDSMLQIFPPFDGILENEPLLQRSVDLAPTGEQYAVYAEARWQATDKLILDLGLRWDRQTYSSFRDNEQRSPRFNALYRFGDDTELRVSLGRFYQAQEINELQVGDGLTNFSPPQYADHFVASFVHRFESGLSLRAEYYQKDYDAPIARFENVFDSLVIIPELQIDRVQIDAEKSFVKGAEITLTGSRKNFLWWAGYVWSSTEDRVAGEDVRRSWDQKHSIKAGMNTEWGAWDISAAGTWHSGWPETRLVVGSATSVSTTPRNSLDYADFHSLDVRASRTFMLSDSELTTFIEVSNLYNQRNPCCTRYTVKVGDDGSNVINANQSHWLPLVPSVGVVWKF